VSRFRIFLFSLSRPIQKWNVSWQFSFFPLFMLLTLAQALGILIALIALGITLIFVFSEFKMPLFNKSRFRDGFTLIELLVVVGIISILAAIAIPQYAKFRRGAQDAAAQEAAHAVAVAEEAYFVFNSSYTTNYGHLVNSGGLVVDYSILYSPIDITVVTDPPSYTFSVNHKADGSTTYTYMSEGNETLFETTNRVTANCPTMPTS
jgi:type IV pilus assembly protein PilA